MPRSTPWIILLCKFSDDPGTASLQSIADYAAFFAGEDPESIPSYWRDVSYGELDLVTGTEISPWLRLPQKRSDHVGLSTRKNLFEWAKAAGRNAGIDFDRFFGTVAFFAVQTDLFGTSDDPHVVCDILSAPAQILQEYGHAYGLQHSRSVIDPTDYTNPFCIMSSMSFGVNNNDGTSHDARFIGHDPTFPSRFGRSGPGLCSPYLFQEGWLPPLRVRQVVSKGTHPETTLLKLSALGELGAVFPQAAIIEFDVPQSLTYFIEYRRGEWDKGVIYNPIVVHQVREDKYSYFAGYTRTVTTGMTGIGANTTQLAGRWYVDTQVDLSVEFLSLIEDGAAVLIRIAPAAAGRDLSVRAIANSTLQLSGAFSIKNQVLSPGESSVRDKLIYLLGQE
jgi:hypothetical protein